MTKLVNRAKMTTATTGTGTITLGSAVDGYQTFAAAGVSNAAVVRYVIEDGDAWEIGLGTYSAGTLTRGSIESSNADAALNLTGNAVVYVSAAAADLQELVDFADNFVLPTADGSTGQVLTTNGAGTLTFSTITGYTDADVDTHLNTGTATSGEVLSWTGSDYDWVTVAAGATDINGLSDGYNTGSSLGLGTGSSASSVGNQSVRVGGFADADDNAVAIGYGAHASGFSISLGTISGQNATTGTGHVGLGYNALRGDPTAKLTGSYNIGLGYQTGYDLSTGANNFLGGYQAGTNLTTGSNNVAIGNSALDAATTGGRNIAIGQDAMGLGVATNANGTNIVIGYQAGYDITTAGYNTLIGPQAGQNLTTGGSNLAVGNRALNNATSSLLNIAIGQDSLKLSVGGGFNTAIGVEALANYNSDTGNFNTALGFGAGSTLTSGENNTLIGNGVQPSSATASNEITLGNGGITRFRIPGLGVDWTPATVPTSYTNADVDTHLNTSTAASGEVLSWNGSDYDWIAVSVPNISITDNSVAVGPSADNWTNGVTIGLNAGTNATSSGGVAIGKDAGRYKGGAQNIGVGDSALRGSLFGSSGARNIGIGFSTGNNLSEGANNFLGGYQAGTNLTTGSDNTLLGYQAGDATTTGSNQIVIGQGSDASSATVSNEITLGNASITRFRVPGAGIDNTSAALSGTTPSVDVGARDTYTLSTTGNTTFTFTGAPSSGQVGTFSLIVTAGGAHTLTWPASVDWAGGTAPDAPASGEKDIYTFMTVDGGTTWYGFLAGDAMA